MSRTWNGADSLHYAAPLAPLLLVPQHRCHSTGATAARRLQVEMSTPPPRTPQPTPGMLLSSPQKSAMPSISRFPLSLTAPPSLAPPTSGVCLGTIQPTTSLGRSVSYVSFRTITAGSTIVITQHPSRWLPLVSEGMPSHFAIRHVSLAPRHYVAAPTLSSHPVIPPPPCHSAIPPFRHATTSPTRHTTYSELP